jgi:hypothetical protein
VNPVGTAPDAPFKLVAVGPGTAVALTSISIHDGRSTIRPLKTDTVRPWPAALKSPCGRKGVECRRTELSPTWDYMQPSKTNKVLVNVILDRSGSMHSSKQATISGYNEYIQGLRADKDTEYSVSLTQFDAPMTHPELTVLYLDRALADVPELTGADYEPRGNTPLYDAIGEGIRRVDAKDRAIITLIITDGQENSSMEFTKDSVKALIKSKEDEGWTFAFLGADIDSYAVGGAIGMAARPGSFLLKSRRFPRSMSALLFSEQIQTCIDVISFPGRWYSGCSCVWTIQQRPTRKRGPARRYGRYADAAQAGRRGQGQ